MSLLKHLSYYGFVFILLSNYMHCNAKLTIINPLEKELTKAKTDAHKINILNSLAMIGRDIPIKAITYGKQASGPAKASYFPLGPGKANETPGFVFYEQPEYNWELYHFKISYNIYKKVFEKKNEIPDTKNSRLRIWAFFRLSVFVLTCLSLIILIVNNRKQKAANKILIIKNKQILRSERLLYKKKKELEEIIKTLNENNIPITGPETKKTDSDPQKYVNSKLNSENKVVMFQKIEKLMNEDKLFLQSDLSLEKLAKLLNTNRSYISQVINNNYNQNFNNFLNQYRIKEACLMLSDPKNQLITIEGIAKKVGFNSITTFNRYFKKFIGVNPSFYAKSSV